MALAEARRKAPAVVYGSASPRIAPPVPARSRLGEFRELSASLGTKLYPWQETAARYLTALGPGDRWLYQEVAIIVARQNGKTELLVPLITQRLLDGQRVMHTAQDRILPREVFYRVADIIWEKHRDLFPTRNGRPTKPRYANGQEEIRLSNGGIYSIVAPSRNGARGPSRDLVIIDEVREMVDHDFIAAAKPTTMAAPNPQIVYLSNAGTEDSVVLNALKARSSEDPALAYLEWSAEPQFATDDVRGWLQSNPSIGHNPATLPNLEREHRAHELAGTLHIFNTEHLCRWVASDLPAFVPQTIFEALRREPQRPGSRPAMAVSLDPLGKRASAVIAWQEVGGIAFRVVADVTGDPIDADALGRDLNRLSVRLGATELGYDPETDAILATFVKRPTGKALTGGKFTAACSRFVTLAQSDRLRWEGDDAVSEDMRWTARRTDPQDSTFRAVAAKSGRPVTTIMAAIRAVWLASSGERTAPRVM